MMSTTAPTTPPAASGVEAVQAMAAQTARPRDAAAAEGLVAAVTAHGLAVTATTLFAAAVRALADITAAAAAQQQQKTLASHTTGPLLRVLTHCVPGVSAAALTGALPTLAASLRTVAGAIPRSRRVPKSLVRCLVVLQSRLATDAGTAAASTTGNGNKGAQQQMRALLKDLFGLRTHGHGARATVLDTFFAANAALPRAAQLAAAEAFCGFVLDEIRARVPGTTAAEDLDCLAQLVALCTDFDDSPAPAVAAAERARAAALVVAMLKQFLPLRSITPAEADAFGSYCALVATLMKALHGADRGAAAEWLRACVEALAPHLKCPAAGPAARAADALMHVLDNCIDAPMVAAALPPPAARAPPAGPLAHVVRFARRTLLRYANRGFWQHAFVVVLGLCRAVGRVPGAARQLLRGLLQHLCRIHDLPALDCVATLEDVFGGIVTALGAEEFLACVPLNLDRPLLETDPAALDAATDGNGSDGSNDDDDDGGANHDWLLPVLARRLGAARAPLALFADTLLPQANALAALSQTKRDAEHLPVEARNIWNRHLLVWSLLPGCCASPRTVAPALRRLAPTLGDALKNPTYTAVVATALRTLVATCRSAASSSASGASEEGVEWTAEDVAEAQAGLKALTQYAKNFLPCLFNTLATAPAELHAALTGAIEEYLAVAPAAMRAQYFQTILGQIAANTAPGAAMTQQQVGTAGVMLGLAVSFVGVVDAAALDALLQTVVPLLKHPQRRVQKGAWKALQALCTRHNQLSRSVLYQQLGTVLTAEPPQPLSKKLWLRCTAALVASSASPDNAGARGAFLEWLKATFIVAVIPSIILGTKDSNYKTRRESFAALETIARAFVALAADDTPGQQRAAEQFTSVLLAGLGALNAHMVACTVVTLASVLYTFCAQKPRRLTEPFVAHLAQTVFLLLAADAPEIIKAVLQFANVLLAAMPAKSVEPHLGALLQGLVTWTKTHPKNLRREARVLFEKLLRKYPFELVAKLVPDDTRKVLNNIRKTRLRRIRKREQLRKSGQLLTREQKAALEKEKRQHAFERTLDFADLDSDDDDDEDEGESTHSGAEDDDYSDDYGSDMGSDSDESDDDDDEDDSDDDMDDSRKSSRKSKKQGVKRQSEGVEREALDAEDPMDMVSGHPALRNGAKGSGRGAGAPDAKRRRKAEKAGRVTVNEDGLIVVEEPDDTDDEGAAGGATSAALDSLRSVLGGRGSRRGGDGSDAEAEEDSEEARARAKSRANAAKGKNEMYQRLLERKQRVEEERREKSRKASAKYSGENYKGKGSGDVKRSNAPDPFAYLPLDFSSIRKHAAAPTSSRDSQYSGYIGASKKGAERARERLRAMRAQKKKHHRR